MTSHFFYFENKSINYLINLPISFDNINRAQKLGIASMGSENSAQGIFSRSYSWETNLFQLWRKQEATTQSGVKQNKQQKTKQLWACKWRLSLKRLPLTAALLQLCVIFFPISSITKKSIEVFLWAEDVICCTSNWLWRQLRLNTAMHYSSAWGGT